MNMLFASLLPPELFKFVNTRHVTSFLKMSGEGEGRSTQEFLKSKIKKGKKEHIPIFKNIQICGVGMDSITLISLNCSFSCFQFNF